MKLNIFGKDENGKKTIVKTYEVRQYDLMFGTVEELAREIKLDELKDINDEKILMTVGKLMITSMNVIKDLLMDMFDGITEDEIKHTTVREIAGILIDVVVYTITELDRSFQFGDSKNAGTVSRS